MSHNTHSVATQGTHRSSNQKELGIPKSRENHTRRELINSRAGSMSTRDACYPTSMCCATYMSLLQSIDEIKSMNVLDPMLFQNTEMTRKEIAALRHEITQAHQSERNTLLKGMQQLEAELIQAKNENAQLRNQLVTADGQLQMITLDILVPRFKKFENKLRSILFRLIKPKEEGVIPRIYSLSKWIDNIFQFIFTNMRDHIYQILRCMGHEDHENSDLYKRNYAYIKSIIVANFEKSSLQRSMRDEIFSRASKSANCELPFSDLMEPMKDLIDTVLLLALLEPEIGFSFKDEEESAFIIKDGFGIQTPVPILPTIFQIDSKGKRHSTKMRLMYIS